MKTLLKTKNFYFVFYIFIVLVIFISNNLKAEQEIKIIANEVFINQEKEIIEAQGDVLIIGKKIKSKSDSVIYNKNSGEIDANGNVSVLDEFGNHYFFENLKTNDDFTSLDATNIKMRLKDDSRIVGRKIIKDESLNIISDAEYTPCLKENYLIENCPGWKLKAGKVFHNLDTKTIHYDHARIHIFNLPVFYLPYFAHPDPSVNKRTGFLMPTIKSDDQLGDTISLPFFYNISSNKDLTITPNFQGNENNFYELDYRHLNKFGHLNINSSINDNDDNLGSRNHFFADADINNKYGTLKSYIQTSNNDTYMRKMKINDLTVLKSGIDFERSYNNTNLSIESNAYKHLTRQDSEQWEYLYPLLKYDINSIEDEDFGGRVSLNNIFRNYKGLDNSYSSLFSSQLNWTKVDVNSSSGIIFDNHLNFKIVSSSIDYKDSTKDEEKLIFYPQMGSKISLPLIKTNIKNSQTLTPIIMPILAPYNNYTNAQAVNNSNIFSFNRASGLDEWESGPRINYGVEWYIDFKNDIDVKLTLGQSAKINKNKSDKSEEISDYILTTRMNLDSDKYIDHSIALNRNNVDIKESNTNAYFNYKNFQFAIDHNYTSSKYSTGAEQIRIGGNIELVNDFSFNFTGTRNLNTNNNIGYQYGILYENDCLGIDFNYYRDLTEDRDISISDGLSLTIVLKPFGSTKAYGNKKVFGPQV